MVDSKPIFTPPPDMEKHIAPDLEKEALRRGSGAPEKVLLHSNDADEAMKAFEGHEGEILVLDEGTSKRLLRKIDRNIIPVCYLCKGREQDL